MSQPQIVWLPDGRRLHMNHGPIDLIVEAWGETGEVSAAYRQGAARFRTVLTELVEELKELRKPVATGMPPRVEGAVALRMHRAVAPYAPRFITPMAAVAGAVADEVLAAMVSGRSLSKAYVNNGGDIALHLAAGEEISIAVAGSGGDDRIFIGHADRVRGVATSGWRGRSFSLGIADAVTVLARDGASADAAATMIANAVDLPGHPAIVRVPANELQPDSDLGDLPVTQSVGPLADFEVDCALDQGMKVARTLLSLQLIEGAILSLAGRARTAHRTHPINGPAREMPVPDASSEVRYA